MLRIRCQLNHCATLFQMESRRKQVEITNTNTYWLWLAFRWTHAVTRHIKPTKFSSSWRKGSKTSINEVLWYVFFVLLCTSWKVSSDHAESQNGVLSNSHKISWCSQSKLRWLSSNPTFAQLFWSSTFKLKLINSRKLFWKIAGLYYWQGKMAKSQWPIWQSEVECKSVLADLNRVPVRNDKVVLRNTSLQRLLCGLGLTYTLCRAAHLQICT